MTIFIERDYMIYQPYQLSYSYNSLEPYIDAKTMELHYTKHYQTYLNNLNTILSKYPKIADEKLEVLLSNIDKLDMPDSDRTFLKNNAGGYLNHNLYWKVMGPKKEIDNDLAQEITKEFGSPDKFRETLSQKALSFFGSGWAWLVRKSGRLKIYALPNQDAPCLLGDAPVIGLDVWEHAYYLQYQNRRAEYIDNWWKTVKII